MQRPTALLAELTTPRGAALRGRRGCRPAFGAWGEDLAAQYVESLGWTIIARNSTCDVGESALIARAAQTVGVIDVKT